MQWEQEADFKSASRELVDGSSKNSKNKREAEELVHCIASVIQAAEKVKEMQVNQ